MEAKRGNPARCASETRRACGSAVFLDGTTCFGPAFFWRVLLGLAWLKEGTNRKPPIFRRPSLHTNPAVSVHVYVTHLRKQTMQLVIWKVPIWFQNTMFSPWPRKASCVILPKRKQAHAPSVDLEALQDLASNSKQGSPAMLGVLLVSLKCPKQRVHQLESLSYLLRENSCDARGCIFALEPARVVGQSPLLTHTHTPKGFAARGFGESNWLQHPPNRRNRAEDAPTFLPSPDL